MNVFQPVSRRVVRGAAIVLAFPAFLVVITFALAAGDPTRSLGDALWYLVGVWTCVFTYLRLIVSLDGQ